MVIFFLYIIFLWIVNAWHDADYYNKKNTHVSGAVLACLSISGLFLFQSIGLKVRDTWDIINLVFVALTIRWIVFDIVYNKLIKQSWYYVGNTSKLDKWLPNWLQFTLKILCLFLSIPIVISFINYLK